MALSPFPPGALVAAYFRDSGGDTQELSVIQQESAFREWCAKTGLIPGAIFKDIARPGSSVVGRAGFHDMIHHFRNGLAKEAGLVIWSYSRFAREFDDSQFYRADLRRRGYVFHSLNDEIPEGSIGRLFEAVIDWKNEQFLIDLSRDTRRGLHDLVKNYGAVPGVPPRGFKREPVTIGKRRDGRDRIAHRWAPDPEVIPRVRQAFRMRAEGKTLAEIHAATRLYGSFNSYNTFFSNRLYIGVLDFGGQELDHYCEAIIDPDTWAAVQAMIQRYVRHKNITSNDPSHPRRTNSSYLLSGLAFCARCGSPLFGAPVHQRYKADGTRNADYLRYACARAYRRHDCDQGQFPAVLLDRTVIDNIQNSILLPEKLVLLQEKMQMELAGHLENIREQWTIKNNELTGLQKRITHLAEAIAESGHTRTLLNKLETLEAEETELLAQLAALDRQAGAPLPDLPESELAAQGEKLRSILSGPDLAAKQFLLRGFVERITVDRDGPKLVGSIAYFFPPQEG